MIVLLLCKIIVSGVCMIRKHVLPVIIRIRSTNLIEINVFQFPIVLVLLICIAHGSRAIPSRRGEKYNPSQSSCCIPTSNQASTACCCTKRGGAHQRERKLVWIPLYSMHISCIFFRHLHSILELPSDFCCCLMKQFCKVPASVGFKLLFSITV